MNKKFYKCKVCGDIHYGAFAPDPCPTCRAEHSYEETTREVAKEILGV